MNATNMHQHTFSTFRLQPCRCVHQLNFNSSLNNFSEEKTIYVVNTIWHSSTYLPMTSQLNTLATTIGVLAFSALFYSASSNPGPSERIFDASIIQNLNDKTNCVAAIALQAVVPKSCSPNGIFFVQECTAAVIGRKTLLSNANCIRNLLDLNNLLTTRLNFFYPNKYPLAFIGAKSVSGLDVEADGVFKISITESFLEYHPDYNGSSHDLVAIKLDTAIPMSFCPQPFSIPSKIQNELTYAGPFMISWGQPACTGLSLTGQTYSMAPTTNSCSNAVDGFTTTDDQICVSLKRVQDNAVKPQAAQGDLGAPIYVSVASGDNGNVAKYVLTAILGVFPKSDPVLHSDPYGAGCSKTSVVPAISLLDSKNMAFLNDLADKQKDIMKSLVPGPILL